MVGARAGQRGGALILSILMLTAMSGLGLLAVTASTMGVSSAGTQRNLTQAQYVAEAGLIAVSSRLYDDPVSFVRSLKRGGARRFQWDAEYFGDDRVFVTEADSSGDRSMGFDARGVDFSVWIESASDVPGCSGYSTAGHCCMKVGLVSEGRVGGFDDDGLPDPTAGGARKRVRAEYAVPYPCPR